MTEEMVQDTLEDAAAAAKRAAVAETLEIVLSPGRHSRLSPYVEDTQFQQLFGRRPDGRRRYASANEILDGLHPKLERLAATWREFKEGGKVFVGSYSREFLDMYLAYYFSVAVPQVQLMFLELFRQGNLPSSLHVLDIGVGPGTTAVALLDFLVALNSACALHDMPFPVTELQFLGLDQEEACLEYARETTQAYCEVLRAAWPSLEDGAISDRRRNILDCAAGFAWKHWEFSASFCFGEALPTLVVASRVMNELGSTARDNFKTTLCSLPEAAIIAIAEPGDRERSQALLKWRKDLLAGDAGFEVLGPCGQEFGGDLPPQCDSCWMARRESLHRAALYERFQKLIFTEEGQNSKKLKDHENELLSWSYVLLRRALANKPASIDLLPEGYQRLRFIGRYHSQTPVSYEPDRFKARAKADESWAEYLKVCPEPVSHLPTAIQRSPGFEVPPLRFGDTFVSQGLQSQTSASCTILKPDDDAAIQPDFPLHRASRFLSTYGESARRATDELAHRLFGFESLRDFQHEIIGRALTGRSVFGIAATGGGKSECFILPAMIMSGVTIVVSPLRALMADQYDQRISARYGLHHVSTYINGEVSLHERQARLRRMELGYYKLVYVTPEQLEHGWVLDFVERADRAVGIRYLAVDEAHCISQWGHDFRSSYLNLVRRLKARGIKAVRIALTATASPHVREDICHELDLDPRPASVGGDVLVHSSNRPEISFVVRTRAEHAAKGESIAQELELLRQKHSKGDAAAIVFMPHTGANSPFPSSDSSGVVGFAAWVERRLKSQVAIYHGRMESEDNSDLTPVPSPTEVVSCSDSPVLGRMTGRTRRGEQRAFIEGKRDIMVATKGFGMGVDKSNIRLVLHRTPPENLEAYAQEAGRAGRDGEPARAILYFTPSPATQTTAGQNSSDDQADYDIQKFFIDGRYVRRNDVAVMRAFLRQASRTISTPDSVGHLIYATNDEMLTFFDSFVGYEWPAFPKRRTHGSEPPDYEKLLERGHLYGEKTQYLKRILDVLYRTRVPGAADTRHASLVLGLYSTGARMVRPQLEPGAWSRIVRSRAYFGPVLSAAGMNEEEFCQLLQRDTLIPLAERLGLNLYDVRSMLEAIKQFDGYNTASKSWRSDLLNFRIVEVPCFGPAAGKNRSPSTWREYAGARIRAKPKVARERAARDGRKHLIDDDWFSWEELPTRFGWQIELGALAQEDTGWNAYLDHFMQVHDTRQANDWLSYRRLLTHYVGVSETGQRLDRAENHCLRAILLGYLKSGEVVLGGNCRSCSNCVADEQFTASLDECRALIAPLTDEIAVLLLALEEMVERSPNKETIDRLLELVAAETASNSSVALYLTGWCDRLLDETPDHQAAHWVQAHLALSGDRPIAPLVPRELGNTILHIIDHAMENSGALEPVLYLAQAALEQAPDELPLYPALAQLLKRLGGHAEEEARLWHRYLDLLPAASGNEKERAYGNLTDLYEAEGPLADSEKEIECRLNLAALQDDPRAAFEVWLGVCSRWSTQRTLEELEFCRQLYPDNEALTAGLLCAWAQVSPSESEHRASQVLECLASESKLLQHFTAPDIRALLEFSPFVSIPDSDSRLQIVAVHALLGLKPVQLEDALMWLQAFPSSMYPKLAERYGLKALRLSTLEWSKRPEAGRPTEQRLISAIAPVMREMQAQNSTHEKLHERLGREFYTLPAELIADYVDQCARLPGSSSSAVAVLNQLREKRNNKQVIRLCLDKLARPGGFIEDGSLRYVVESFDLFKVFCSESSWPVNKLDADGLELLWRIYDPVQRCERADMLVEAVRYLRQTENPNWKSPVSLEVEALCLALRFDDAMILADRVRDLKIGFEPAIDFVRRRQRLAVNVRNVSSVNPWEPVARFVN